MILFPTALSMRQKPPAGQRLARPVSGGFWHCAEPHGGVSDAAGCSAPAKVIGGVTRVQGPFGGPALKFDNVTGYVDCGLNGNTAFNWSTAVPFARTFWAWVRRPTSSSVGPIFAKGNNSPNSGWSLSVTTTGLSVGWVGASNAYLTTSNVLSVGDWHMVAIAWDGVAVLNGGFGLYVDGKLQGPPNGAFISTQNGGDVFNLWVGHAEYVGGSGGAISAWADLEIDHWGYDHRFYSPDEISDLYRRPFRNFAPAPIFRRSLFGGGAALTARPQVFVCT